MKWITLVLVLLSAPASATLIGYNVHGIMEDVFAPAPNLHPISMLVSVDTETGWISSASADFLGSSWTQTTNTQYLYEAFVGIDGSTLMHWMAWTLELTNGINTLSFGPTPEWKVPYLGDNPLTRLDESVAIGGLGLVDGTHYGLGLSVSKIPEPNSLLLMLLAVGGLLVSRWRTD